MSLYKQKIKVIDIGGGFESPMFIKKDFKIKEAISKFFNNNKLELYIEPGRSISNDASLIITKVIRNKKTSLADYLAVDIATNYLIPLPLAYYPVISQKPGVLKKYSVVDGICSTAGVINKKTFLPETKEGDLLLILNCGAYTYNMYEHFYSLRPIIILWENTKTLNKRETFQQAVKFLER